MAVLTHTSTAPAQVTQAELSDEQIAQLQALELKLLDEFDRVCTLHNIPYFLFYGTLLGAVRHKGFIPWDDDIDVIVWERDLERLKLAFEQSGAEGFFYQCSQTDPDYNMCFPRLRLDGTCAIEGENIDRDVHHGVWIDIYPFTEASPHKFERTRQKLWGMVKTLLTIHREPFNHGKLGRVAYKLGIALLDHPGVKEHAIAMTQRYMGQNTGVVCTFINAWLTIKLDYPMEWFGPCEGEFEGRRVPIPSGYDEILTARYGNYMELPPLDERHGYHTLTFFDPDHSYLDYRGSKYCTPHMMAARGKSAERGRA